MATTSVADVRDHGALGNADASPDSDDTAAIQSALDTKNNVYLPRGVYRISGTLRFYDAQTIYGDAKGTYGQGSQIVVSGGIAAFRAARYPLLTRDVVIRDLAIWNEPLVHGGPAGSVAVDFTGVGFSSLQRLSVRDHEIGVIGRDSAVFSATVRADSSGTVLKIPAPYPDFAAVGQAVDVTDPRDPSNVVTVGAKIVQRLTNSSDPNYPALVLDQATPLKATYHAGALVYPNPVGGYYNSMVDCEIAGCRKGVWLSHAGNAWTVLDGRFAMNDYGIYIEHSNGSRFRSTFERNAVGLLLHAAAVNQVMSGSYFEGNGKSAFPGVPQNLEAYGAVCFTAGSIRNVVEASVLSNSGDVVVDDADGSNTCAATLMPAQPSVPSGHGSGRNVLFNADFAVDSARTGVADGWAFARPKPSGWTMAVDTPQTGTVPGGAPAAQRWSMDPGTYPLVALYRRVEVVPGQWYTFTARTKVDANGAGRYQIRIADALSPSQAQTYYYTGGGLAEHDWTAGLHRFSFQVRPGITRLYLLLEPHNTGGGTCTVDTACTAWFAKFQLEPGRGLPTESRDSGLMADVRTGGAPLDPANSQNHTSIRVSHAYHVVTGTGTILNIVPPEGFSGMVVLRAAGTWHAATGGTGRGAIGNAFSTTPGKVAIGWYDGGADTWWFTVSA